MREYVLALAPVSGNANTFFVYVFYAFFYAVRRSSLVVGTFRPLCQCAIAIRRMTFAHKHTSIHTNTQKVNILVVYTINYWISQAQALAHLLCACMCIYAKVAKVSTSKLC